MALLLATPAGLYVVGPGRERGEPEPFRKETGFLALARAPGDPAVCYAATADGSVYRSGAGGRSWEPVGSVEGYAELSSLAAVPGGTDRLLAGMEPAALFLSEDDGRTWTEDSVIRGMSVEPIMV